MPDEAMKILNIEKTSLNNQIIESQYKKFYSSNDPSKVYRGGPIFRIWFLMACIFCSNSRIEKVENAYCRVLKTVPRNRWKGH